ncbi:phenol hydroxylase subunit P4 [Aerosticca soli]|uniref:Phenol hydroxylase, P4 oxygenase component DmpO n=1 Tax=Aerosticca soli TaxID=2010829 RepID=A0A2Z6E3R6_9GAMM|nr:phenol hydroxylase subunit P4 [Aerosticca soli]MDI3261975.1 phenol hydroxylase subunit P4 [Fulvimonas sp.]BBD79562.1 phenol hydroxylase, P4 oxygenase component DmpO [Aerosticca soli]
MPVRAMYDYKFEPRDRLEHFHGNQLLYLEWQRHLLFAFPMCVPVPPDLPFGAVMKEILPSLYGSHPDWARVRWDAVDWELDGAVFQPAPERGLAAQGIGHKSFLRFTARGLDGLGGQAL